MVKRYPACQTLCQIILAFLLCVAAQQAGCVWADVDGPQAITPPAGGAAEENSFVAVVRDVGPSVVSIRAERVLEGLQLPDGEEGIDEENLRQFLEELLRRKTSPGKRTGIREASGLIVTPDGYVLTNYHVVADAIRVVVQLHDGSVFDGKVAGSDSKTDLALVRIKADGLKVPPLGDSERIEPGQWAIAIGSPYGFEKSVTLGVISAKSRPGFGMSSLGELIQTDASINPGNSGGPLVNIRGEVIGINSIVVRPGQGIGFAIPINLVKRVVQDLIEQGKVLRAWVGLGLQDLTPDIKRYFGLTGPGALVRQVVEKGPADMAGLKPGDIIVAVEGKQAANTQFVINTIQEQRIGQTVNVEGIRNGKSFTAAITTTDEEKFRSGTIRVTISAEKRPFGLAVRTITPGIAQKLGHPDLEGVVITRVEMGSPAHAASLMADDVIVLVNGRRVKNDTDYLAVLKKAEPEKGVLMMIDRLGSTFFVVLRDE